MFRRQFRSGSKSPAWQRKEGKSKSGGLNRKGIASYRAANPGSKLSMAVTTKPSKLKKGSKAANRRKSFCARMSGDEKRLTSAKTARDPNSRINKFQDLELITKIQRQLKQLYQNVGDSMISGGVDNMEKYKYMLGQAHAYQYILQEISNLLNKKEQKDEQGTVIDLGKRNPKT
jgi:hypothetical protein